MNEELHWVMKTKCTIAADQWQRFVVTLIAAVIEI